MRVTVENGAEIARSLTRLARDVQNLEPAHARGAAAIKAATRAPVVTGALQRSISAHAHPTHGIITVGTRYGHIVHARNPFAYKAADRRAPAWRLFIEQHINRLIHRT